MLLKLFRITYNKDNIYEITLLVSSNYYSNII